MDFNKLLFQLIAEMVGSFILGILVSANKTFGSGLNLPFACFIPYMMFWKLSNSHFNPCTTLICMLRKDYDMSIVEGLLYIVAQLIGFFGSNFMIWWFYREVMSLNVRKYNGDWQLSEASGLEFFGSVLFLLINTLQLSKSTCLSYNWGINCFIVGTSYGVYVAYSSAVTGGSFNPSYALCKTVVDSFDSGEAESIEHLWIYLLWPFLASFLVFGLYEFFYKKAYEDEENKQNDIERVNEAY